MKVQSRRNGTHRVLGKYIAAIALIASGLTVGLAGVAAADTVSTASTVVAAAPQVAPNGTSTTTITVTLSGGNGATDTVKLAGVSANSSIINGGTAGAAASESATAGVATFTVADATAQAVTYQATDVTDAGEVVTETATVTFADAVALSPVGAFATSFGNDDTQSAATLVNVGDVLVIWAEDDPQTATLTNITTATGPGAIGTAVQATQYTGTNVPSDLEIWYAPVTATGTIVLQYTWSTTVGTQEEYATQEFQPASPATYSTSAAGNLENPNIENPASETVTFPTLTSTAGELYVGYNALFAMDAHAPTGTTAGYTAEVLALDDLAIFNPSTSAGSQSPITTVDYENEQSSTGALISATLIGATDTITFDSEGGSAVGNVTGADDSTITLPAAPTLTGSTFDGWFTSPTGGTALTSPYTLLGSVTLYAQWTDTIQFNSEGGSAVANVTGPNGSTITLPAAPTRAGYVFNGWFVAVSGGTALTSPYTLATSTTLYAQWTANATDTVMFNSEGGSAVANMTGPNGSTITLPAAPTRAGYTFNGWFVAVSGGTALTSPYTLAALTTTLYAQWTAGATDTVMFNSEGGSAVANMTGPNGSTITLPAAPTRAGYTFNGWFAAVSGGTALTSPYTLAATTTTLYAQWTASGGGGGGGGGGTAATLTVKGTGGSVSYGTAFTPASTVSEGLLTGDTASVSTATYTYTGTGSTTYAASTTAPTAVGTYNVTPSAATVVITPATDASKYATTYDYVGGALTITTATLTVTAGNVSITAGATVTPTATVSGLVGSDTAAVSTATYTFAGTGSTTYAASATAPSAVGTYSITPTAATVVVTPATDAADYSTTYTYVAGTLTIKPKPKPPVVLHAGHISGVILPGQRRSITIIGTGFSGQPKITGTTKGIKVSVSKDTGSRLSVWVTVPKGTHAGHGTFTIRLSNGKICKITYTIK